MNMYTASALSRQGIAFPYIRFTGKGYKKTGVSQITLEATERWDDHCMKKMDL